MRSSPLAISDSSHQSRLGTGRGALDAMKKIECLQVNIYISFYIDCLKITARSKRYPSLLQFGKRTASSPTFTPLKCRTGKMARRHSWCGLCIARMAPDSPEFSSRLRVWSEIWEESPPRLHNSKESPAWKDPTMTEKRKGGGGGSQAEL